MDNSKISQDPQSHSTSNSVTVRRRLVNTNKSKPKESSPAGPSDRPVNQESQKPILDRLFNKISKTFLDETSRMSRNKNRYREQANEVNFGHLKEINEVIIRHIKLFSFIGLPLWVLVTYLIYLIVACVTKWITCFVVDVQCH